MGDKQTLSWVHGFEEGGHTIQLGLCSSGLFRETEPMGELSVCLFMMRSWLT